MTGTPSARRAKLTVVPLSRYEGDDVPGNAQAPDIWAMNVHPPVGGDASLPVPVRLTIILGLGALSWALVIGALSTL